MRYKIIEFSIKNQRFFNSLAFIILIAGIFIYINTQKDLFPEIKDAQINVQVIYPGASAKMVQQQIVTPIENKITPLTEIKKSSSISRKNIGITQFTVDRKYYDNLNDVQQLVQNAINSLDFPKESLQPQIKIYTINNDPILSVHLQGDDTQELYDVSQYFETDLQHISLVDEPIISGREEYQYEININPQIIADRGISIGEIYNAIQEFEADIPGGDIIKDGKINVISIVSPIDNIQHLEDIVIRVNEKGQAVLLKDLAQVEFDFADPSSFYSVNEKSGIVFHITKARITDILKVKKVLQSLIDSYQEKYPDIKFTIFSDTSQRIDSRIKLLNSNLTIGLVLVFIVLIFFFNFSTALWTTAGVPIAFCIGLLSSVLLVGVNINTISMIGFLLVLGIVVDDGIVFSENAYRHFEMGKSPKQAVIDGMGEVAPSVVFAALTTMASIGTQLSLGGRMGDFAKPLPIIMIATLAGSLFESLLILPGHLEHAFSHMKMQTSKISFKVKMFSVLQRAYAQALTVLVTHRKKSFFSIVAIITTLTFLMLSQIPFVFFAGPPKDVDVFFETKVGSSVQETKILTDKIASFLSKNPAFSSVYSVAGVNGEAHKSFVKGEIKLDVSPRYDWLAFKLSLQDYVKNNVTNVNNLRFHVIGEDTFYIERLEIAAKGTNLVAVTKIATEVQTYLRTLSNIDNPRLNISPKTLAQEIIVNPTKAKMYGITPREVAQNISMAYEGIEVGSILSNGINHDIRLQYDNDYHTYESLTNMKIPNKFTRFVNLDEISEIKSTLIDTDIYTEDGLFAVKIQDSLYETSILSNNSFMILSKVQEKFSGYTNDLDAALYFDSEKEEVSRGVKEISIAIFIGVSLVFLILLYMFNSFISTVLAIFGIPFIFFGLTIGLYFMGLPLNNMALIGMIALLGLVVNDSIVLLEFLYTTINYKEPFLPALVKGVSTRFRPIFMTTTTTLVGVAPIAFGFAGNEFLLQPLAVVIFFGVLAVSLITLVLLPLIISILQVDLHGGFLNIRHKTPSEVIKNIRKFFRVRFRRRRKERGNKS